PPDIFPQLWRKMDELYNNGRLVAPLEVKREIEKGDDDLVKWIKNKKKMFIKPNQFQSEKVKEILKDFPFLAKAEETGPNADPWIIALAIQEKQNIESQLDFDKKEVFILTEESKSNPRRIPSVAQKYGIKCVNIIELFRKEGWKF
ncbi:MAG: DUF4411 family protein, partial [Candidatus Calescibacterium sp.]|nr:DUF4411 family protein [Candidatus Calescibacterium sp.]